MQTLPTNSTEFINALSHYYRGEMGRMTAGAIVWIEQPTGRSVQLRQCYPFLYPEFVDTTGELFQNATNAFVPGSVVVASILGFYGFMLYVMIKHRQVRGELAIGEVHV